MDRLFSNNLGLHTLYVSGTHLQDNTCHVSIRICILFGSLARGFALGMGNCKCW